MNNGLVAFRDDVVVKPTVYHPAALYDSDGPDDYFGDLFEHEYDDFYGMSDEDEWGYPYF